MSMNTDWQSLAAPIVVLITVAAFALRSFRKKKRGGGCASCSGGSAKAAFERK
jgi:FeoB-associated Cys-rich membrane protein